MAEPITWVAFGITAWEILRHTFRRLARHEEQRYRQWDGKYDGEGWERRRHCHLHLVHSAPPGRLFDWASEEKGRVS